MREFPEASTPQPDAAGRERRKAPKPSLRLRVSPAAESKLRSGHPWLFAESIREQNREGALGELAVIYDRKDRFLAVGLFEPESPLRVRVLHAGKPQTLDAVWWSNRLEEALRKRQVGPANEQLREPDTTGWRWINGESDGWPGLVLDRYGETLALKLYAASWLPRLSEILVLIVQRLRPERVVLRLSRNIQELAAQFGRADAQVLAGPPVNAPVIFSENGLRFEADVLRGQKTGFFLDQRDNRRRVEALALGREVLNAFSFTGGFSLYAARGGAAAVTDLDISSHALAGAERNFDLNKSNPTVGACRHEAIQAEAFEWLGSNESRRVDMVILDPPSLAKREAERAGALRAYGRLASEGLSHLNAGGILVACSCSAHVSAAQFYEAVLGAARQSGRRFEEIERTGHAADHPAKFAEMEYLKAIFLRVS